LKLAKNSFPNLYRERAVNENVRDELFFMTKQHTHVAHLKAMPLKVVNAENEIVHNREVEEINFGEQVGMPNSLPFQSFVLANKGNIS